MATRGKRYKKTLEQKPQQVCELREALEFIKAHPGANFDETVDLAFRLGVDPRQSDQTVRGSMGLPHGTGKSVRVLVFATGPAADAATEAGADHVGQDELIAKISDGWLEFDVAIATPDAMKEVRKLGKVLGPRGLMPNPKVGTVTDDTGKAVREARAGRIEFRMDRNGNVHVPVGKLSFQVDHLVENAWAVINAVRNARPATAKGEYIRRCTVSSTMGVGIRVNVRDVA
ncbi:MAG: 50S ribosomal protein L1 [Kiritimatiellae bacterium]|nr:50S ribosomal protein L1 [Kiritimatiellia bacterium]